MERPSRNFQPSSSNRKLQAIFASANRYFTENRLYDIFLGTACLPSQEGRRFFTFKRIRMSNYNNNNITFSLWMSIPPPPPPTEDVHAPFVFYVLVICFNDIDCIDYYLFQKKKLGKKMLPSTLDPRQKDRLRVCEPKIYFLHFVRGGRRLC